MDKELIRRIIYENREIYANVSLVRRQVEMEGAANYVIVGARQSGKSYLLYQIMKQKIEEGVDPKTLVYLNFDDERLRGMSALELDLIVKAYGTISGERPMFFFDEIQNVEGWANFARRLANEKYRVYITGSNAKMLSREMETVLGGRYMALELFPYTFREYLDAQGVELTDGWEYGRKEGAVVRLAEEYFLWGGYPELVMMGQKRNWLTSLFGRIYFNDTVVRYSVKNDVALRLVVNKLAESVRQPVAVNRIANMVRGAGATCSASTVLDFLRYLEEAFVIFSLKNLGTKFVERESVKKYYFVDNGLLHLFLTDCETALLENLCAICLRRKYGTRVGYYRGNVEVDFYVPDEGLGVQACYRMRDAETLEREVRALEALHSLYPLRRAVVVTYDDEDVLRRGELEILVLPFWKWCLGY